MANVTLPVVSGDTLTLKFAECGCCGSSDSGTEAETAISEVVDFVEMGAIPDGNNNMLNGGTPRGDYTIGEQYFETDQVWDVDADGKRKGAIVTGDFTANTSFADAVVNGLLEVATISGTDNFTAFESLIREAEATGKRMYINNGTYRVKRPSTAINPGSAWIRLQGDSYEFFGPGHIIFDDEGVADGTQLNVLMTPGYNVFSDPFERKRFSIKGNTWSGTWSNCPTGNTDPTTGRGTARTHFFAIHGFRNLNFEECTFLDVPGSVSRIHSCNRVHSNDNDLYRIGKSPLRFLNCTTNIVTENRVRWADDDSIDIHTRENNHSGLTIVSGNHLAQCEGMLLLGTNRSLIGNNILQLMQGTSLFASGNVGGEGQNSGYANQVNGNIVIDSLTASSDHATLPVSIDTQSHIALSGIRRDKVDGMYDASTNKIVDVIGDNLANAIGVNATTSFGGQMDGNTAMRTRMAVAKYSDFGEGLMFTDQGWIDPPVTDENFVKHGLMLIGPYSGFQVNDNMVSGMRTGDGVHVRLIGGTIAELNRNIVNGQIKNNLIEDCLVSIGHNQTEQNPRSIRFDIDMEGNTLDGDKRHIGVAHNADGSWDGSVADSVTHYAFQAENIRGFRFCRNKIRNVANPVFGDAAGANGIYKDNIVIAQTDVVPSRGVGNVRSPALGFDLQTEICTPGPTYGDAQ